MSLIRKEAIKSLSELGINEFRGRTYDSVACQEVVGRLIGYYFNTNTIRLMESDN